MFIQTTHNIIYVKNKKMLLHFTNNYIKLSFFHYTKILLVTNEDNSLKHVKHIYNPDTENIMLNPTFERHKTASDFDPDTDSELSYRSLSVSENDIYEQYRDAHDRFYPSEEACTAQLHKLNDRLGIEHPGYDHSMYGRSITLL